MALEFVTGTFEVTTEACVNSLGMDIKVYHVVCGGVTYAESRYKEIADLIAATLNERVAK